MDDIQIMKQNYDNLQKENTSLKNKIQLLKEKENSYQTSISRIKKIQSECESSYTQSINDYKKHEEEIKKKYLEYQKILEKQNEENEKRFIEEINSLKKELKEKDNIINTLKEKINLLNEKITKGEINDYFKEKEYENIIISKDRKLTELNETIKQVVSDAIEEIKRLSEQIEDFQKKIKINNPMNLLITEKENIDNNNNKNLNKSVDYNNNNNVNGNNSININQNDMVKQNQNLVSNSVLLSDNHKNILNDGNPLQRINNNNINSNQNIQDILAQLYILKNDKEMLANQLKEKEKEVNFWKNVRSDLYENAQAQAQAHSSVNIPTNAKNNKFLNDLKFKNIEKTLKNYGNKINTIKKQYDKSLKYHQKEIDKLKNDMGNSASLTYQTKMSEKIYHINTHEKIGDNDEDIQAKSSGDEILHTLKMSIPSKEGIRNEYINSEIQKINISDNKKNKDNNDNIDNNNKE